MREHARLANDTKVPTEASSLALLPAPFCERLKTYLKSFTNDFGVFDFFFSFGILEIIWEY